ncbi:hypothetical protein B566_EDAN016903 [Ephemera danica]|nr:hypothetical protein B566_EDAN016903 [Ephemera danica]
MALFEMLGKHANEDLHVSEPPEVNSNPEERFQVLNNSLHDWINTERFHTFMKITRGNLHQAFASNKFLVLAVVEENKLQDVPSHMIEFRDMVESVIRNNRDKYHKFFQFGWTGSPDLANSVAMSMLPLPSLLVINSTTNHHHLPSEQLLGPTGLSPEAITAFLDSVMDQSAPVSHQKCSLFSSLMVAFGYVSQAYGGNTILVRLYRAYFEARTSLAEMWMGNPVLTAVLFGLPLGFLTLICYSICCADILDAEEDEPGNCETQ